MKTFWHKPPNCVAQQEQHCSINGNFNCVCDPDYLAQLINGSVLAILFSYDMKKLFR